MINSVLKAIKILNLFSASEVRLSLSEISHRLDMPKSTTHNLLTTLLSQEYIEKVDGDLYALGTAPLALSQNIRVNVEIRDPAAPLLRRLADYSRESTYLTIQDGPYALYIYAVESPQRLQARSAIGERVPLHCTSVGKAIMAFLSDEAIEAIVAKVGLPVFTENTLNTLDALRQDLARTRTRGYALDIEEHEVQTYCVGAPVFDRKGHVLGACSISGGSRRIVTDRLTDLSTRVVETARAISRQMGYVPSRISDVPPVSGMQP
jgi:DNA-binding IclR family transcriptional regulator